MGSAQTPDYGAAPRLLGTEELRSGSTVAHRHATTSTTALLTSRERSGFGEAAASGLTDEAGEIAQPALSLRDMPVSHMGRHVRQPVSASRSRSAVMAMTTAVMFAFETCTRPFHLSSSAQRLYPEPKPERDHLGSRVPYKSPRAAEEGGRLRSERYLLGL